MNSISDNNNAVDTWIAYGLVDTTPNGEKLSFYKQDIHGLVEGSFGNGMASVDMCDQ